MKTRIILSGMLMSAALTFPAGAGTLFYVPIPAADSDAQSGLDPAKGYTNAVAAGTTKERNVNGVGFAPLSGGENVITANGVTLSAATGRLANGGGKADSIQADGTMARLLSAMIFNDGAEDNSEQYAVLDPATLTAGKTYDLRVYIANATGENRDVNLAFAGDGKPAVSTDFFNEDDATTSAGGFADPNQVYYINYRFTWDGVSTPGFTATQRFGSTPFCLFALTNQEVGGDLDVQPAGAMVQVAPEPIAAPPSPRNVKSTAVEYEEDIGVSSDVFYSADTLRRNGRWVTVGSYGRCWQPSNVDDNWEPYTRGRWVYSRDDGWVWDSDEDFGWATYHYGRWFREEDTGWCWVPGKVWGPGWVSWRHGHSHVGWAPLPPAALVVAGIGISAWADHRWGMGPRSYNFVNARDFGAPSMARVLIPRQQNAAIMATTNNVTNIARTRNGLFNGGPSFNAVNNAIVRSGNSAIPTVSVNRHAGNRPVTPDGKFSNLSAGVLSMSAPTVTRTKKPTSLPPIAATIAKPKFDKGWNGIADPNRAAALQAKIASETPGARSKTAPARLPGTMPTAIANTPPINKNGLKPFRGSNPGGTAAMTPGQPIVPGSVNPLRPGMQVNPTAATPSLPGQPAITPTGKGKRGEKPTVTTIPVAKPGAPANPIVVTPASPGENVVPTTGKGKRGERPGAPNVSIMKPGQPVNPAIITPTPDRPIKSTEVPVVKPGRFAKPGTVSPPVTVPPAIQSTVPATPKLETGRSKNRQRETLPSTSPTIVRPGIPESPKPATAPEIKPAAPVMTPVETMRHKKGSAPAAPTNPVPVVRPTAPVPAPVSKPAPVSEPVRIKRKPEPTAPAIAPRVAPTPPPAPAPTRVQEPLRVKKPTQELPTAPSIRQIQRPAPAPSVIQPRPAPQPVAAPRPAPVAIQPRPAPMPVAPSRPAPISIQPRSAPAPPVNIPARPAAPQPGPNKGPQPTPTPAPGLKR